MRRVTLVPDRHFPPQFVGESFEEDYVVLCLLTFRCLDWHQRDDAFAVLAEVVVCGADKPKVSQLLVGL